MEDKLPTHVDGEIRPEQPRRRLAIAPMNRNTRSRKMASH
jgi:hypothetical protein